MAYGRRIDCPNGMVWINGECMNVTPPPPDGDAVMSVPWCQPWPQCQGYTDPIRPRIPSDAVMRRRGRRRRWRRFPAPSRSYQMGGRLPYYQGTHGNPYRRGGSVRRRYRTGGMFSGSPKSGLDGYGRN